MAEGLSLLITSVIKEFYGYQRPTTICQVANGCSVPSLLSVELLVVNTFFNVIHYLICILCFVDESKI